MPVDGFFLQTNKVLGIFSGGNMIILGITDSITSGAAMVVDGRLVAAVSEERIDRNKMSMGFPALSIAEVLDISGIGPQEIDYVAVSTEHLFWRSKAIPYSDYFREKKPGMRKFFINMGSSFSLVSGNFRLGRSLYYNIKKIVTRNRRRIIPNVLKDYFGITSPVLFIDHHLCHAASAYFTSGFENATVITHDGAGDSKSSRIYVVKHGRFQHLHSLESYHSIGNYYSYVTHLCGFKAHKHEGKITGLAAHGEPEYLDVLKQFVRYNGFGIQNIGKCFDHSAISKLKHSLPNNFSRENLSASIQLLLEQSVGSYCNYWLKHTGFPNIAVAGGVFANVKLNQRIHELESVQDFYVHPGMGDEGLAVGAALYVHSMKAGFSQQPVIKDIYLGGEFNDQEALEAIRRTGFQPYPVGENLAAEVAKLLSEGKVIARCVGRMEYGPRALGNRTIMYQTTDPRVNTWLNQRLSRTEFMPFAPVTLWENRHHCYDNIKGAEETARFMTITFECLPFMREISPAVCHVDNTARPQLIRREDNPSYYDIVKEYEILTGIPSLVNTSFNIHEEPIVYKPDEALKAFAQSRLDGLILGSYLVVAPKDWKTISQLAD